MTGRCLSTLVELPLEGYSAGALARLADRRKFPDRLGLTRAELIQIRATETPRLSISGVQDKVSLRLHRGELTPTESGGQYILKPTPGLALPRFQGEVPANEHLTMQAAEQLFGIRTAANALIRLADGELAYITRRFDRTRDGGRVGQEDFCQLMERSRQSHGEEFKYDSSYEELGEALRRFCPAYAIESEKLFRQLVFGYLVGNGDAHLKNVSLLQTGSGDFVLSPAYDLVSSSLHLPTESRLALDLFKDDEYPQGVLTHGFPTGGDFLELARRYGLREERALRTVTDSLEQAGPLEELVSRSFLSPEAQTAYVELVRDRGKALRIGLS